MKNFNLALFCLFFTFLFFSCQKKNSILEEKYIEKEMLMKSDSKILAESLNSPIQELSDTSLKSFLRLKPQNRSLMNISDYDYRREVNNTFFDLLDFPINIIVKENNSGNLFLTSQGLNKELTFATKNNNENQNFYLSMMPLTGYLAIWTNVNGQRKLISAGKYNNNPSKDVLYVKDGTNSIGAMWSFLKGQTIHDNSYILQNADVLGYDGAEPTMWNVYNKVIGSQSPNSVFFDKYRNSGKQEFEIRPNDDFEIIDIEYIKDESTTISQQPDFVSTWYYENNTSIQQNMSTAFSQRASRTSSFNQTTGGSIAIGASAKIKVGLFFVGGELNVSTNITTNYSSTYGKSETFEDAQTYNFPISVAPRTSVTATATVGRYLINLKYKAKMKGSKTGKIINVEGRWEGVTCTDVKFTIEERALGSNKLLKIHTLDKIPVSLYKL